MSQTSTSICQSILMGKCRQEEYAKAEWMGSAVATWDDLLSWFDASQVDPQDAVSARIIEYQRYRIKRGWAAYLLECSTSDGSLVAFKPGITSHGSRRLEQHDCHPLLNWKQCRFVSCGSRGTAIFIENYILAAAAHGGAWLGGEWIVGRGELTPMSLPTRRNSRRVRAAT